MERYRAVCLYKFHMLLQYIDCAGVDHETAVYPGRDPARSDEADTWEGVMYIYEEAIKKWCPMSRDTTENMGSYNRHRGQPTTNSLCLGEDCMMWRWIERQVDPTMHVRPDTFGYCGLAGKP